MHPSRKYQLLLAVAILSVAGVIAYRLHGGGAQAAPAHEPQAASVEVAVVHSQPVIDWHAYSGRLEAVDRVRVRPLVSGTLIAVHFGDGALVNKDDVLFTIDPRPYQAAVDRVLAQLAAAKARKAYTAAELQRGQRLLAANAIAKSDLAQKRNAAHIAAADEAAADAALRAARLDLEHTEVRAPISGRVSRAEVTLGNVVQAGAGAPELTTLVSVDRLYASFNMDEQSFLHFMGRARGPGNEDVPVRLGLGDEEGYPRKGHIAFVDNGLDPSSGTIRVRAVFDNTDGRLLPGLYARIHVGSGAARPAVLVDEAAIGTDQDKRFVLVLDEHNKTAYRQVTLGASQAGRRVIEQGLTPGERIVVSGLQHVRPGDPVSPRPALASAAATSSPS
jgi:multidrug efflux system membrane fusion protein